MLDNPEAGINADMMKMKDKRLLLLLLALATYCLTENKQLNNKMMSLVENDGLRFERCVVGLKG